MIKSGITDSKLMSKILRWPFIVKGSNIEFCKFYNKTPTLGEERMNEVERIDVQN